jgi:tetratricopeptide (TPR) repeat protein
MEDGMIKLEEELSRFVPIDLKTLEQKPGGIPDDVRTAISMYNKAIGDIGGGNEDMAVIALRKAIAVYPGFYEAMNLLGLCHIRLGEEEKARALFEQVVQMDDSSLRAKGYIDRLDGILPENSADTRGRHRSRSRIGRTLPAWLAKGLAPESNGPWVLKYVAGFLIGVLLAGAVWYFQPPGKPLVEISQEQPDLQPSLDALQKENDSLKENLAAAAKDLENANKIQQTLQDEMESYKLWMKRLSELRAMVSAGSYRDVIMKIEKDYQGLDIPADIQDEIIAINNDVKPKAVKQIYDAGVKLYKGNAKAQEKTVYKEAMTEFDLAISIVDQLEEKPTFMSDLLYTGAKSYYLAGYPSQEEASKLAVDTFNKLIAFDPKSAKSKSAATWIKEIQAGRGIKP